MFALLTRKPKTALRYTHSSSTRVRIPDHGTAVAVTVEELRALAAEGKRPTPENLEKLRDRRI